MFRNILIDGESLPRKGVVLLLLLILHGGLFHMNSLSVFLLLLLLHWGSLLMTRLCVCQLLRLHGEFLLRNSIGVVSVPSSSR